jgi:hypothetical protein
MSAAFIMGHAGTLEQATQDVTNELASYQSDF